MPSPTQKLIDETLFLDDNGIPMEEKMTSSNILKYVVSEYDGTTTTEVAPRKPFHLNFSFKNRSRLMPKSLMYGSLIGTTSTTATTFKSGGGRYDYKRISALQSSKIQSGCEDCNSEDRLSLQVQHKLPFDMDTEVSQEAVSG